MKRLLFILIIVTIFFNKKAYSTWVDLNTGINDSLTGVVFWGNNGMVSGKKGLYYTINGGVGNSSWSRFNIINNSSDSIIYNNTKFSHCYSTNGYTDYVFACGNDTVNNLAVIIQIQFPSLTHHIVYHGNNILDTTTSDVKLNNINYCSVNDEFYAVGDNSLIIQFNVNSLGNQITNNFILNRALIDFKSIDFYNNSVFSIAANNFSITGDNLSAGQNFNIQNSYGDNIRDVLTLSNAATLRVGNKVIWTSQLHIPNANSTNTVFEYYSHGAINAKCVFQYNDHYYIGTDHGIFKSAYANSLIFERQTSSSSSFISDFWDDLTNLKIYACGNNGLVYYSDNDGGGTTPYVKITQQGGCIGQNLPLSFMVGSANSCQVYFDSVLVSSSCSSTYTVNQPSSGAHEVKVVALNSHSVDSITAIYNVVDTPKVNLPYFVNDVLLCKEEPVIINIDSSEQNVFYEFYNIDNQNLLGYSLVGNNNTLSFTSDLISDSGAFQLRANSSLADCSKNFTDTIIIDVEKTKAKFHIGLINAKIGESVRFYEHCVDANNYEWLFPSQAGHDSSSLSTPIHAFDLTGNQSISLKCWSNDGCSDSIIKIGPHTYLPTNTYDSTWVNIGLGGVGHNNPSWIDLNEMSSSYTGYFNAGKYDNQTFPSQIGASKTLNNSGAYLNKYNRNGVLKWSINSPTEYGLVSIKSTVEDSIGNIYACGRINHYYVDNKGDTIWVNDNNFSNIGVILKLDSLGRTIWFRSSQSFVPNKIAIDNSNNIVVASLNLNSSRYIYLNGVVTDTLPPISSNHSISKYNTNGELVWYIPIQINHTNIVKLVELGFDDSNSVYLTGVMEHDLIIYPTNNLGGTIIPSITNSYGGKTFLAKFDSVGVLKWGLNSNMMNIPYAWPSDMKVSNKGNVYIVGQKFFAKITTNGISEWIRTTNNAYYGLGSEVELQNDTLYILGHVVNQQQTNLFVNFNNLDYTYFPFRINQGNYFVATYDTSGYIHDIFLNSVNQSQLATNSFNGMFRDSIGNFYIARNAFAYSGTTFFVEFNDTILTPNNEEGWVTKFNYKNGIHILPSYKKTIDTTICLGDSYTLPNGNILANVISSISDTLSLFTTIGTDSVIITFIHVAPDYNNINENIYLCAGQGYTFPDGSFIDSINSTYTHINYLSSVYGCDSIVTSTLQTAFDYEQIDSVLICYNSDYIFPDSVILFNVDTVVSHISQLQTKHGCDSVVTTVLIPNYSNDSVIDSVFVCFNSNYTFIDGTSVNNVTSTQMHESHLQSIHGCDSLVKEVLVPVSIDAYVTQNENVLTCVTQVDSSLLNYTWIDCYNNNAPIIGENLSQYVVNEDGSYGVIISYNNCSDTSQCLNVIGLGISADEEFNLDIHPNPTKGSLVINLPNNHNLKKMILTNTLGETILEKEVFKLETIQLVIESAPGVYFANFINQKGVERSIKVVKH